MIHEIYPHRFNNHYLPDTYPDENAFILHYKENSLLLKTDGINFELPRKSELSSINKTSDAIYLFSLDDTPCFLILQDLGTVDAPFFFKELSLFRSVTQHEIAWIIIVGFHLFNWYLHNRFCGKCGHETVHKNDERALICQSCSTTVFPKISPAIIVAVVSGDKILLARNSNFPGRWYSLIAGYVDIGESLEETVVREVKEEVGIDIHNIRYYKSQPWPLSSSMMVGFIADADETQPITVDTKEISEAAWFSRSNIPEHPSHISIAGEMISKFENDEL
jgi:NAD+ diphosphatase